MLLTNVAFSYYSQTPIEWPPLGAMGGDHLIRVGCLRATLYKHQLWSFGQEKSKIPQAFSDEWSR